MTPERQVKGHSTSLPTPVRLMENLDGNRVQAGSVSPRPRMAAYGKRCISIARRVKASYLRFRRPAVRDPAPKTSASYLASLTLADARYRKAWQEPNGHR